MSPVKVTDGAFFVPFFFLVRAGRSPVKGLKNHRRGVAKCSGRVVVFVVFVVSLVEGNHLVNEKKKKKKHISSGMHASFSYETQPVKKEGSLVMWATSSRVDLHTYIHTFEHIHGLFVNRV